MRWFLARRKIFTVGLLLLVQYELALFSGLLAIAALTHHLDRLAAQWPIVFLVGGVIATFVEHSYIEHGKLSPLFITAHRLASRLIQPKKG